jgi:endonuclease G, mitochondrial
MNKKWIYCLFCFCSFAQAAPPEGIDCFGLPEGTVITPPNADYVLAFDGHHRTPRWVMELLTKESIGEDTGRPATFTDPDFISKPFRPMITSYHESGYDIGHLAPCDDFGKDKARAATFTLANAVPQNPKLNRGVWLAIEKQVRASAIHGNRVWVCTFPIWEDYGNLKTKKIGNVCVPTAIGKTICICPPGKDTPTQMLAWVCPNKDPVSGALPIHFQTSVRYLETESGLDFWNGLSKEIQDKLEK